MREIMPSADALSASSSPLVSIIIPSYNRANYLGQTIRSALSQTYDNFELLIVDDGSTDNTAEVVRAISSDRLRYLSKEHTGAPGTRNLGITQSRGEFIIWLGSDDILMPTALSDLVAMLRSTPDADVIYGDLLIVDDDLNPLQLLTYEDWYGRNQEFLARMVNGNSIPDGGTLIRKKCYQLIGDYDTAFVRAHDYEWWSRLILLATFKRLAATTYQWRWHKNNMSSETVTYDTSYDATIVKRLLERHPLQNLYPRVDWKNLPGFAAEAIAFIEIAHHLFRLNDSEAAAGYLGGSYQRLPLKQTRAAFEEMKLPLPDIFPFPSAASGLATSDRAVCAQMVRKQPELFVEEAVRSALAFLQQGSARPDAPPPLVSVIVPTFNRPALLGSALQSILDQSFQDFEVIVVNDAGQDVSSVVGSLASAKVRCLSHETNLGLAAARNTGIAAARGKYLAYLDDDDIYYPNHLETLVARLEQDGSFVAYSDAHRGHLEEVGGVSTVVRRDLPYSFDFDPVRILFENFIPVLCVMHRRECLEKVGGFNPLLHRLEDWDLWIRMSRCYPFLHVAKATCEFRWRAQGGETMTSSAVGPFDWARLQVVQSHRHLTRNPAGQAWYAQFAAGAVQRLCSALAEALAAGRFAPREIFGTADLDEVLATADLLAGCPPDLAPAMAQLGGLISRYARSGSPQGAPAAAPLVSIIVPTHNRPHMLKSALDSILNQTFQDFEILVVNDAGSDVQGVIDACSDPRIKGICHDRNRGLAAARNTGISAASGRYLTYLDDDDLYYPEHLSTLVAALQQGEHRVAYSDAFCAVQQLRGNEYTVTERTVLYSSDFDYRRILVENFIPVLCVMHERSCLAQCGPFDESLKRHEDWDLWIRMSRHFKFTHIPKATCEFTFRPDGSGMTSGTLPTFLESTRRVYQKHVGTVAADHQLKQLQGHALMQLNLKIFGFLQERVAPFSDPAALPFAELEQTGASRAQILSAYHSLQGKKGIDAQETAFHLEKALTEYPENFQACLNLVTHYLGTGAYTLAAARLTLLEAADPAEQTFAELRTLLDKKLAAGGFPTPPAPGAKPFSANGETSMAVCLGKLQQNPDDREALLNLGRICASRGQQDDARLLYARILTLVPDDPLALDELARLSRTVTRAA